jgi:hypothetical protein
METERAPLPACPLEDDEAWHVTKGMLIFRFEDSTVGFQKGTTVFVTTCVGHTYYTNGPARNLAILISIMANVKKCIAALGHGILPKWRFRRLLQSRTFNVIQA